MSEWEKMEALKCNKMIYRRLIWIHFITASFSSCLYVSFSLWSSASQQTSSAQVNRNQENSHPFFTFLLALCFQMQHKEKFECLPVVIFLPGETNVRQNLNSILVISAGALLFSFSFLLSDCDWWRTRPWRLFRAGLKPGRVLVCTAATLVPSLISSRKQIKKHGWIHRPRGSLPQETKHGEGTLSHGGHREILRGYWLYAWVLSHVLRGSLMSPDPPQLPVEVSCDNVPTTTLS